MIDINRFHIYRTKSQNYKIYLNLVLIIINEILIGTRYKRAPADIS